MTEFQPGDYVYSLNNKVFRLTESYSDSRWVWIGIARGDGLRRLQVFYESELVLVRCRNCGWGHSAHQNKKCLYGPGKWGWPEKPCK